ncbi:MAG: hypothetical protein QM737_11850 [Ferruginibacter sp.]
MPNWIKVYRDRFDPEYQKKLRELLDIESLKETSKMAYKCGLHSRQEKRITIKFSGLSSLSLLGGAENRFFNENETYLAFKNLILNTDQLEDYKLDIELLFSYPFSDFNYNLILSELTRQDGDSVECLNRNNSYALNFYTPKKLTENDLQQSNLFKNLKSSLNRLQDLIIEANKPKEERSNENPDKKISALNSRKSRHKIIEANKSKEEPGKENSDEKIPAFNSRKSRHKIVVKFSVLNIMTCFLKINNQIFIDPYTYSKDDSHSKILNLSSPLTHIVLESIDEWKKLPKENPPNNKVIDSNALYLYKAHKNHFLSLIGHFRYLWHHPLSIIAHDATWVTRSVPETLGEFKLPMEVSFKGKASLIRDFLKNKDKLTSSNSEIDLWSQYLKNEFLRHSSKFIAHDFKEVDLISRKQIKLLKIPIFIVGAWKKSDLNNYMKLVKDFFINPYKYSTQFITEIINEFSLSKFLEKYIELSEINFTTKIEYENRRKVKHLFNRLLYRLSDVMSLYEQESNDFFTKMHETITQLIGNNKTEETVLEILSRIFDKELALKISKLFSQGRTEGQINEGILTELKSFYKCFNKSELEKKQLKRFENSELQFNPIIIDTDDTEEIMKTIYRNLNQSQLGFVIQTNDISDSSFHSILSEEIKKNIPKGENSKLSDDSIDAIINSVVNILKSEYYSKPNVYLEKGYLMGRLGKRKDRIGRDIEAVCVFKETLSHTESNNLNFSNTLFANYREFQIELYRVIKWIWNITDFNSTYALKILDKIQKVIEFKDACQDLHNLSESIHLKNTYLPDKGEELNKFISYLLTEEDKKINFQRHSYKISSFIKEIKNWQDKFFERYNHNFEFYSPDFRTPSDAELEENYAEYEKDFLLAFEWLLKTGLNKLSSIRKKANNLIEGWIKVNPEIKSKIDTPAFVDEFEKKYPGMLVIWKGGCVYYMIKNKDSEDTIMKQKAGLNSMATVYKASKGIKADKKMNELLKAVDGGKLDQWMKANMK